MRRGRLASCSLVVVTAAVVAGTWALPTLAVDKLGTWSTAASPITGHEEHTATLLRNGKVLVAGGPDASAELYDPAANRWTPAASMATARVDHTATLLANGKVLVAGGRVGPYPSNTLATTELYNPILNSWSPGAPMIGSRAGHTATLLSDGRVLVVGGSSLVLREGGLFPTQPPDAEVYDPTRNRWTVTSPMGSYRLNHTATLLKDGRVLIAGGQGDAGPFASTEIYDASQDRWVSAAPMGVRRSGHAAVLMANGDVLVAAGLGVEPNALSIALTSAELYDPKTNLWVAVANMAQLHGGHSATLLGDGMVLVVGTLGHQRPELYDPDRNVWLSTGPAMDRYLHTSTRLPSGKVLIVGGIGVEAFRSALLYDPAGVAPQNALPVDPRIVAAVVLAALLLMVGMAMSLPAVRQRLRRWRPRGEPEEWIT